jgi:class 3 adenylate cyclase
MANSITESNRMKEQFMDAAQRFIPSQYLEFLEKDSITKVQLGDHVSAEMAVMFSDIRGFTTLSEKMTAQENFNFVNEYLKLVSPIIQKHEGFVVKFLGDGMMAIFPYGVADAVQAGIEKARAVQAFNDTLKLRGLPPISVGIGIHTGPMMVGMIGEDLRMQGDAFSDNVNLTARLEGLNKFYGSSIIVSEEIVRQISQPEDFKMRSLGKAIVKGRVNALGLYEIYDGLPPETVKTREAARADFEHAVSLYQQAKFREAGKLFDKVLEHDPNDKAAKLYLKACSQMFEKTISASWDGAIIMDAK